MIKAPASISALERSTMLFIIGHMERGCILDALLAVGQAQAQGIKIPRKLEKAVERAFTAWTKSATDVLGCVDEDTNNFLHAMRKQEMQDPASN